MEPNEQTPLEILREFIKMRYQEGNWRPWQERSADITSALRALGLDQARVLAREVWDHYDHEEMLPFLGQLNTSIPGALAEWTETFIAEGHLQPGWLYLGSTPTTTGHLLVQVNDPEAVAQRNSLLVALAWIGDKLVQEQYRAWRESPPSWRSELYIDPHEYAVEAGWELTPEGKRRDLCHQTSYELILTDERELTPSTHAVAVMTPTEIPCGWCGRQLVSLVDIDLRDPRCAFVLDGLAAARMAGTRLRIAHCLWCSSYATLYTDVDLHGAVRWSEANERMPQILDKVGLGTDDDMPPPNAYRLVLGPMRKSPFEAVGRFGLDETGTSQFGGYPEWIQDAEFPVCPGCQRRMMYVGQASWEDVYQFAEGSTFGFVCLACGKAATVYQQT